MRGKRAEFWAWVNKNGPLWQGIPCWLWLGAGDARGYGHYQRNRKRQPAHRIAYEELVGPIPEGLEIDHLCRNHACVNPAHLEAVTHAENMRRAIYTKPRWTPPKKTHCIRGHDLALHGVLEPRRGRPVQCCRLCRIQAGRDYRARQRALRPRRDPASRTHCPKGHPYDEANTYRYRDGSRACRQCHREKERQQRRRNGVQPRRYEHTFLRILRSSNGRMALAQRNWATELLTTPYLEDRR